MFVIFVCYLLSVVRSRMMRTWVVFSVVRGWSMMFVMMRRWCEVSVMIVERVDYDDDAAARRLYGGAERACFCLRASCDDAKSQEGAEYRFYYPFFI